MPDLGAAMVRAGMAWAIVGCSRGGIQQEAEAKAAGGSVHSRDCDLRAGRAARAGFLAARLVAAEIRLGLANGGEIDSASLLGAS